MAERLHVLWFMAYFQIPRRQVSECFGIARSTLYRWLRRIEDASPALSLPHNRTPAEIASLVWGIALANAQWGRVRIANQLALLGVFIAASTVRNILERPKPPEAGATITVTPNLVQPNQRAPIANYPNHVWSIDCTEVRRWGLWPTQLLVIIDHFSRKIMGITPLEGPNAGWVCSALEATFAKYGPPKHLITDQHPVFRSKAVGELLASWHIKHRFGAIGKHGSIAVTERVIWTLKYEWLFRAPLVKGFEHLETLCVEFAQWYNDWRPYMKLGGLRPNDVYARDLPEPVPRDAKVVPLKVERRHFAQARVTGFRLPKAA